ncbi:MAG: TIGR03643 family protein [Verrucomicrobia bacterium]|jgi:uncharacterized protein (TIGR03643 family)|nr:TIGR03643 family protein [Verrucomicrobiota bacterium]
MNASMTKEATNTIIRMAWCDRTSFETIEEKTGLSEAEVIKVMRAELKRKSFNNWRARVSGRSTKHRKRFRIGRKQLKQSPPAP